MAANPQASHAADARRMTAATRLRGWFVLPGLPAGANPAGADVSVTFVRNILPSYTLTSCCLSFLFLRMTAATRLRGWFVLPGLPAGANPAGADVSVTFVRNILPSYTLTS